MLEIDRGLADTLLQLVLALKEKGETATAQKIEEAAETIRRLVDDNINLDVKREQAEHERDESSQHLERCTRELAEAKAALAEVEEERDALKAASLVNCAISEHLAAHPSAERVRLPSIREGRTARFEIIAPPRANSCPRCNYKWEESRNTKCYFTNNCYPDGRPGEVLITTDRAGSTTRGALEAFAISTSVGLQYGAPLHVYVDKMRGTRFGIAGATQNPRYPRVSSVLDLWARWTTDGWPQWAVCP